MRAICVKDLVRQRPEPRSGFRNSALPGSSSMPLAKGMSCRSWARGRPLLRDRILRRWRARSCGRYRVDLSFAGQTLISAETGSVHNVVIDCVRPVHGGLLIVAGPLNYYRLARGRETASTIAGRAPDTRSARPTDLQRLQDQHPEHSMRAWMS